MLPLESLVKDGAVRAGASLYPVDVAVNGSGVSGTRFILAQEAVEENPRWAALAWRNSQTGGLPDLFLAQYVSEIHSFGPGRLYLTTESGTSVLVTASNGCSCGSRLKSLRPFGNDVRLDQVPVPSPV